MNAVKGFLVYLLFSGLLICTAANANDGTKAFIKNIHWLGHDTFKITGEKVIYIDPFRLKRKDTADIVLITHGHFDHCSQADIKAVQGAGTMIIAPPSCAEKIGGPVKVVKRGDTVNIGGVNIEVVPAYNIDKNFHPKEADGVGFIITVNGQRIYHAGDTDHIPEMKGFKNVDIALLPVSGTYVMTAGEAVRAAIDISPDIAIPMHYSTIIGSGADARRFAGGLEGTIEVIIPERE